MCNENSIGYDMLMDALCEEQEYSSDEVWITRSKVTIQVTKMSIAHIQNCLAAFKSGKIHRKYLGGRNKWEKIFNTELNKRK